MKAWKLRLSILCFSTAALLIVPVTLTAVRTHAEQLPAASAAVASALEDSGPSAPAAGVKPKQPEAAPKPSTGSRSETPAPSGALNRDPALEEQIRTWAGSLSKEKGFEAWGQASWDAYPLGPGTHSWVILFRSAGTELGYMVVASTEDGAFKLMEYGTGPTPLFSMETLYHSLVQRGLISDSITYPSFLSKPAVDFTRWYAGPLQGVWRVAASDGTHYFDAKTGEELPDIGSWLDELQPVTPVSGSAVNPKPGISEAAEWEAHDPFIRPKAWMKGEPLAASSFTEWRQLLEKPDTHLTYFGKWYGGRALYPLAVSGYHLWSADTPYIRLEHNGPRYVAYGDMPALGAFYTQP